MVVWSPQPFYRSRGPILLLTTIAGGIISGIAATAITIVVLSRHAVLDVPDQRSFHNRPAVRGGGMVTGRHWSPWRLHSATSRSPLGHWPACIPGTKTVLNVPGSLLSPFHMVDQSEHLGTRLSRRAES